MVKTNNDMRNKLIFGVLAVFTMFAFVGVGANMVNAQVDKDYAKVDLAYEQSIDIKSDEASSGDNYIYAVEKSDLMNILGEKVDLGYFLNYIEKSISSSSSNGGEEKNNWICKEKTTFPSGGSVTQTYSSGTNVSGSWCTTNGTGVSISCVQQFD